MRLNSGLGLSNQQTNLCSSVAIIITTRNRFDDLSSTLSNLLDLGLENLAIYIIDDFSDTPIASHDIISKFKKLQIKRNSECKGLIVNRNELASWAKEDVLISLDDDSCFVTIPNFIDLLDRFNSNINLCAVEFDNIDPPLKTGSKVLDDELVQMYTGFGHAVRRSYFLHIGGYREFFYHMCEEIDFGQRAWTKGYQIRKYRKIQVLHRKTPVARIHDRNVYYWCRNTIFLNMANLGVYRILWLPIMVLSMCSVLKITKKRRFLAMKGICSGLFCLFKYRADIHPMSLYQAWQYRKLAQR